MGIDAYLVASTVNVAIAQRLVRKICDHCKTPYELTTAEVNNLKRSLPERLRRSKLPTTFYGGEGCDACERSGYTGRIGIYEVLMVTPRVREAILNRAPATTLKEIAIEEGMTTMFEDGLLKAQAGTTTLSEVLRTINE